jgi:hypothetical protein
MTKDQTALQSTLDSLPWRNIGPFRGGRVVAVAGDVTEPMTFYFGACAGGVWQTTDGGNIWENISDGYFKTAAIGALAVSESDPNVLYAGTGETAIRGNVSHGDGVYRSTDGGRLEVSVDGDHSVQRPVFGRPDQPLMGDTHRVQRSIEAGAPEIEEMCKFWKVRRKVVLLPDELLQQ